jgi:hypothetical protein
MRRTPAPAINFARVADSLALPSKDRASQLFATPMFSRPAFASLDEDGFLRWKWPGHVVYEEQPVKAPGAKRDAPKLQRAPRALCFRFAQLASGSDEQIRVFAERWGPLGFDQRAEEQIKDWRRYSEVAAALLRFTAEQITGGRGSDADWSTILEFTEVKGLARSHLTPAVQKMIAAMAVNTWFAKARGHRILDVVDKRVQIRPGASNLLGVLITQIAHVIARSDESALCAGCKRLFPPKRPPSRGARQYCVVCRKAKVPQRDAARDYRRRTRSKAV